MIDEERERLVAVGVGHQVVVVQREHQLRLDRGQLVEQLGQGHLGQEVDRASALQQLERHLPERGLDHPEGFDDIGPEPHRVVVALVQRHPGDPPRWLVGHGPLGQQRGLSRSGGGVDQAQPSLCPLLQQPIEPGPRDQPSPDRWWVQLGPQQDRATGADRIGAGLVGLVFVYTDPVGLRMLCWRLARRPGTQRSAPWLAFLPGLYSGKRPQLPVSRFRPGMDPDLALNVAATPRRDEITLSG
jgi:hypothetical protein